MKDKVVVLLSTFNGEKYLNEQLMSLREQTYKKIQVLVRDDGSTDKTTEILEEWHNKYPEWISWYAGKNIGYKKSFMMLLYNAPLADYYAFCDQDDWWKKEKVEVAVNRLRNIGEISVYSSNVTYSDAELVVKGRSRFYNNNTFWKALLYNQAVGCTMVISNELRNAIMKVNIMDINFDEIYSHDCWIYRLCFAFDGRSYFDSDSYILYRQHGENQIGGSACNINTWIERANKLKGKNRNIKLKTARELERCYGKLIMQESQSIIHEFNRYDKNIFTRLKFASKKEIYTDSIIANICLWIAIALGAI